MKRALNFNCFNPKSRLLLSSVIVLVSGCILLVGFETLSKTSAARVGSLQAAPIFPAARSSKNDLAFKRGLATRLDKEGNLPNGVSFLPLHARCARATRPAGNGNSDAHAYADSNSQFHSDADGKTYSNSKTSAEAETLLVTGGNHKLAIKA